MDRKDVLLMNYFIAWDNYQADPDNHSLYAKWRAEALEVKKHVCPELFTKPLGRIWDRDVPA